jgi:uncharacterized protein
VSLAWVGGAGILALASFVFGLAGFGLGLVALSLLPFLMPPTTAVPLVSVYSAAFALVMSIQLRRDIVFSHLVALLGGALVGTPVGVWVLATLPASWLRRRIGLTLIGVVIIEWRGLSPRKLSGHHWGASAGVLSGLLGGAVGAPGLPVVLYTAAQGWSPRAMKATLLGFFFANQMITLVGQWWAGLLTTEVAWLALVFATPPVSATSCSPCCSSSDLPCVYAAEHAVSSARRRSHPRSIPRRSSVCDVLVSTSARCSGSQTASDGLANKGDVEPTIPAHMRGLQPTFGSSSFLVRAIWLSYISQISPFAIRVLSAFSQSHFHQMWSIFIQLFVRMPRRRVVNFIP